MKSRNLILVSALLAFLSLWPDWLTGLGVACAIGGLGVVGLRRQYALGTWLSNVAGPSMVLAKLSHFSATVNGMWIALGAFSSILVAVIGILEISQALTRRRSPRHFIRRILAPGVVAWVVADPVHRRQDMITLTSIEEAQKIRSVVDYLRNCDGDATIEIAEGIFFDVPRDAVPSAISVLDNAQPAPPFVQASSHQGMVKEIVLAAIRHRHKEVGDEIDSTEKNNGENAATDEQLGLDASYHAVIADLEQRLNSKENNCEQE